MKTATYNNNSMEFENKPKVILPTITSHPLRKALIALGAAAVVLSATESPVNAGGGDERDSSSCSQQRQPTINSEDTRRLNIEDLFVRKAYAGGGCAKSYTLGQVSSSSDSDLFYQVVIASTVALGGYALYATIRKGRNS
jgi:hypothetical protein